MRDLFSCRKGRVFKNTTIEHYSRLVTLETCNQSDEKQPGQKKIKTTEKSPSKGDPRYFYTFDQSDEET